MVDNRIKNPKRNYLLCVLSFLLCTRHILLLIGLGSIASNLFKIVYILLFLILANAIMIKVKERLPSTALGILFIGIFSFLLIFVQLVLYYRPYIEQSATFLLVFPLIVCWDAVSFSEKDAKVFFMGILFVAVTMVLSIFIPSNYEEGILLLYTLNGNQSGLLFMSIFIAVYTYYQLSDKKFYWWILVLGLLYGCWLTQSRTSFFACIICMALCAWLQKKPHLNKRILTIAMFLFVALPPSVTVISDLFGEGFTLMGESLFTGRETIWPYALGTVIRSPLTLRIDIPVALTTYTEVSLGAHNVWVDIAWNYGLIVAIVFLIALFYMGRNMLSKLNMKKAGIFVACFTSGLIHMSFEASILSGALDYTLYFLLALFFAGVLINKEENSSGK